MDRIILELINNRLYFMTKVRECEELYIIMIQIHNVECWTKRCSSVMTWIHGVEVLNLYIKGMIKQLAGCNELPFPHLFLPPASSNHQSTLNVSVCVCALQRMCGINILFRDVKPFEFEWYETTKYMNEWKQFKRKRKSISIINDIWKSNIPSWIFSYYSSVFRG